MIEPFIVKNVFNKKTVFFIKRTIELIKKSELKHKKDIDFEFERLGVHNEPYFVKLHQSFTNRFCELVGREFKASYVYASFYSSKGICPPHVDRDQCQLTLDYCVSQKEPWPIYINSTDKYEPGKEEELMKNAKRYVLEENDAVIFSGTEHLHYRNRIQENNSADFLFFHFVSKEFSGPLT